MIKDVGASTSENHIPGIINEYMNGLSISRPLSRLTLYQSNHMYSDEA